MTDQENEEFGGKSHGLLTYRRALRIFDFFSFYEMAAVLTLEESLPVAIGTDHGADWSAPGGDFESYWEFVLAHYGSTYGRSEAFIYPVPKEVAIRPSSRPATLDEVLAIWRRGWRT